MCRLFLILQSNAYFNPPDPSNRREETNFADSLFPAFCQKIMLFEFLPFNFLTLYPSFSIELTSTSTISTSAYLCDINSFLVWTLCCQIYIPEQNCDIWETFFFDSQTSYHFKTLWYPEKNASCRIHSNYYDPLSTCTRGIPTILEAEQINMLHTLSCRILSLFADSLSLLHAC